ncbi:putative NAD(P)/FAD-binding protein YdhS [Arthrobacter pigmenti]|uniref:Putative NAD(P)/FAD-binding protein YdhS n=1 Tax=Arthrobacter pigmenti TaxID=271432 RepID=A0A846RS91_9MICC|nr:FAD/NAD(P)-binding protein [Arthrobacter pigmenti]NJC21181.1 putative NAD(P)/FAD-binding protein YdhS [Arthrobacter pigmenti]
MDNSRGLQVAIIGAGPRGTSVLERLAANWSAFPEGGRPRLTVHVVEPYEPGPGHVWRPDQSRHFLMNTPALFPTVVPVGEAASGRAPSLVPVCFDGWRQRMLVSPDESLSDEDRAELAALTSSGFPSRALYGRYLRWVYVSVLSCLGEGFDVVVHQVEARHVQRVGTAFRVELGEDEALEADAVVLAMGHLPAQLNREQEALRDGAARLGLQYWPPAVPADVDWNRLPPRKPVLVRGLGLNFFDIMTHLTEGRGGRFVPGGEPAGCALTYEPSGREPLIIAASRRGTPYRAKAKLDRYVPRSVNLRYCTLERAGSFAADGVQPGFDHDLWPLLHRDAVWAYYCTLARTAGLGEGFLEKLQDALDAPDSDWAAKLEETLDAHVSGLDRLDLEALARPFGRRRFASAQEYNRTVLEYLEEDAAGSDRGEDDPLKMAIGAMNAGRSVIKQVVSDGGLTEASWTAELRGWFEPLVEGLASGPPALRIEQLAALARAGVVRFAGPAPRFELDSGRSRFTVTSPWVEGGTYDAGVLVEAVMPANRVVYNRSVLLRRLLEDGLVRARAMMSEDGVPELSAGLDVTKPPYQALGANGLVQEGLYVLGLQLTSVQWGTAIAAEAGASLDAGGRTLRDADDIARAILGGS